MVVEVGVSFMFIVVVDVVFLVVIGFCDFILIIYLVVIDSVMFFESVKVIKSV